MDWSSAQLRVAFAPEMADEGPRRGDLTVTALPCSIGGKSGRTATIVRSWE